MPIGLLSPSSRLTLGEVEMGFAAIPAGDLLMGTDLAELGRIWSRFGWSLGLKEAFIDEAPMQRVVVIGFELGVIEVTVAQFQAFCRTTGKPMLKQQAWSSSPEHPVHNVTRDDALGFCEWATGEMRRGGVRGTLRLQTESDWEYSATGGDTGLNGRRRKLLVWGDDLPRASERLANGRIEGNDDGYESTSPAGQFQANGYGLRDMAGSLWEWCQDLYDKRYYVRSPVRKPSGPDDAIIAVGVLRGTRRTSICPTFV